MNVKYLYDGVSLQNRRQSNMDSFILKSRNIRGKNALLTSVCDGVGSLSEGMFASGQAVQMLGEWFDKVNNTDSIGLKMRDAILDINRYIILEANRMGIETASTISVLLLIEDLYHIVHVGDSRIYSYENNVLSLLTSDDISESGNLTAYIGRVEDVVLQYYEGIAEDKTFLICSDGLYNRMDVNFMINKLKIKNKRALKESMESLTQYVIEQGEQDNISLALVKIES